MNIGIFGGSFDPVHYGHLALAQSAMRDLKLDKLIFVPAKLQPFKLDRKLASIEERMNMLKLAISEFDNSDKFEISNIEMLREGISYTIYTLREFKKIYPDSKLYFILGTDASMKIQKWFCSDEILQNYSIAIGTRPGYKDSELDVLISEIRSKYGTEIIKINNPKLDISSTDIRYTKSSTLLPPIVERYIKENGLYI